MKKSIIFLLVILMTLSCCRVIQISGSKWTDQDYYRIDKIKKRSSFYEIIATRHDSLFKIVSDLNLKKVEGTKIKKHHYYHLNLIKIFPTDSLLGYQRAASCFVKGFAVTPTDFVEVDEETHNCIYLSENLSGLVLKDN